MSTAPFPPYCVIDNPMDPIACRDLVEVAEVIETQRSGRLMILTDDKIGWVDEVFIERLSIGVQFLELGSTLEKYRVEETRIVFTAKGEQSSSLKDEIRRQIRIRRAAA